MQSGQTKILMYQFLDMIFNNLGKDKAADFVHRVGDNMVHQGDYDNFMPRFLRSLLDNMIVSHSNDDGMRLIADRALNLLSIFAEGNTPDRALQREFTDLLNNNDNKMRLSHELAEASQDKAALDDINTKAIYGNAFLAAVGVSAGSPFFSEMFAFSSILNAWVQFTTPDESSYDDEAYKEARKAEAMDWVSQIFLDVLSTAAVKQGLEQYNYAEHTPDQMVANLKDKLRGGLPPDLQVMLDKIVGEEESQPHSLGSSLSDQES